MTQTVKFSQFSNSPNLLAGDIVVGLRDGQNYQFIFEGTPSGGGGVTQIIPQTNAFGLGQWVKVDDTGTYITAQANDVANAESIGVVIDISIPGQFTLQQSGYITSEMGIFVTNPGPLTTGDVYFLDTAVAGNMVNMDVSVSGEVSKPLFVADSPTSGWVLPYRGQVVGGSPPPVPPTNNDTSIVTINQASHGLAKGDVVAISSNIFMVDYVPALALPSQDWQVVGICIDAPTINEFILQTSGYNQGALTKDVDGNFLVPGVTYYVSAAAPGKITSTEPNTAGTFSIPIYRCRNIAGIGTIDEGYILEQRPLDISEENDISLIHQSGHGFVEGDWVYIASDQTYAKGIATSLATSQVVGLVIRRVDSQYFYLQTNGFVQAVVTVDDQPAALVSGMIMYLSTTVEGRLTAVAPSIIGQVTKPLYVQQQLITLTGIILEQRPIVNVAPPSGGGAIVQVTQTNFTAPFFTTIAGWQIVPGMSCSITPTSAANKILLYSKITLASDGASGVAYKFQRNGVDIDLGDAAGARTRASGVSMGTSFSVDSGITVNEMFVDFPGSTATQTYQLYVFRGNSASASINKASDNVDPNNSNFFRCTSNIILMESQ